MYKLITQTAFASEAVAGLREEPERQHENLD